MAKKSKRITVRYEKDQSGCMWGLISLFDFRHGRTSRKLLADKKRPGRQTVGTGSLRNKFETLANLDEDCSVPLSSKELKTSNTGKPSVKKLIEEELLNELDAKGIDCEHSGHLKMTDTKKTKKSSKKSFDIDADSFNAAEYLKEQSDNNLPVDVMLKEIYSQIHRKSTSEMKFDPDDKADMQSKEYLADLEQKMVHAIKDYLGQKFNTRKDFTETQKLQHSREIMDALQIPHPDKELFLKLAQNPNSVLVKYIRNLHDMSIEKVDEPKSLELSEVGQSEEPVDHKQRLFFRRKVRHQGRIVLKGNENSDTLSKIVILKPGPKGLVNTEVDNIHPSAQNSTANDKKKVLNERVGSNFFLSEIKRKFKFAMGKDHREVSAKGSDRFSCDHRGSRESAKGVANEDGARNSTSKDHILIERITRPSDGKREEKAGKLKSLEINQDLGNIYNSGRRPTNVYVEAKKHLSEMLSSGDESVDFLRGHVPKTLGRILSLPEYSFSPINSPKRDYKLSPITLEKRISVGCRLLNVHEIRPSSKGENNNTPISPGKTPLCISDDTPSTVQSPIDCNHSMNCDIVDQCTREEAVSSSTTGKIAEGDIEILKVDEIAVHEEERSILEAPSDSSESSLVREVQNGEMPDACNERSVSDVHSDPIVSSSIRDDYSDDMSDLWDDKPLIGLPQDLSNENQLSPSPLAFSSSSPTPGKAVGDLEGISDVPERPSPVSVLDPLFGDDNLSPVHATSFLGLPVQPVHIEFEDIKPAETEKTNVSKSLKEDKEVIFYFVKAVLLASGLSWNQICRKWLFSEQLLDLLLINEVELFPNRLCSDQKLLFDCINEVLADFCQSYPPWFSFEKPCQRSEYLVEICEGVYWYLLPLPQPLTLDHLVKKDMSRTRTWMNLHSEAENIGSETCEAIFEDLVSDTILSCVYDSSEFNSGVRSKNDNVSDDL